MVCLGARTLRLNALSDPTRDRDGSQVVARHILVPFILTFISSRVLVFLIVARRVPDLYLHLGGTHVHHLNYGIFPPAAVGRGTCCRRVRTLGSFEALPRCTGLVWR